MRFRKTIKIAPGFKLNISKSGISSTVGKRGLSANIGKNGTYLNTGIPGTGISNREKISGNADNITSADGMSEVQEYKPDDPLKPMTTAERKTRKIVTRVFLIAGLVLLPLALPLGITALFLGVSMWLWGVIETAVNGNKADEALNKNIENTPPENQ
jgi:hypothetical protein